MGYISHYFDVDSLEQLKNNLTQYPGNDYILNMVSKLCDTLSRENDDILIISFYLQLCTIPLNQQA